jgi:hypothetical protein
MMKVYYINPDNTYGEKRIPLGTVDNILIDGGGPFYGVRIPTADLAGNAIKVFPERGSVLPGGLSADTYFFLGSPVGGFYPLLDGPHGSPVVLTDLGTGRMIVYITHLLASGDGTSGTPFRTYFKCGGKKPFFLHVKYLKDSETSITLLPSIQNKVAVGEYKVKVPTSSVPGAYTLATASMSLVGANPVVPFRFPMPNEFFAASDGYIILDVVEVGTPGDGEVMLALTDDSPYTEMPHIAVRG